MIFRWLRHYLGSDRDRLHREAAARRNEEIVALRIHLDHQRRTRLSEDPIRRGRSASPPERSGVNDHVASSAPPSPTQQPPPEEAA